jgi:hypothetical protein
MLNFSGEWEGFPAALRSVRELDKVSRVLCRHVPCVRCESEGTMAQALFHHPWVRMAESVLGHIAAVIVGFVLMVVGLGLGVTMIMLPAGIVIGLIGVAMFVGGLFARIGE